MDGKTIYKYELPMAGAADIKMPMGAKVLSAGNQYELLQVWAIVDIREAKKETRRFCIRGTGHPFSGSEGRHIGTATFQQGSLVLHVFEARTA